MRRVLAVGLLAVVAACSNDVGASIDAQAACEVEIDVTSGVPVDHGQSAAEKDGSGRWRVEGYYDTPTTRVFYECFVRDGDVIAIRPLGG